MEPKKFYYTYDEVHQSCVELAGKVKQSGAQYEYIVAPSRGGLLPGTIFSHQLGIPLYPLKFSTRDHVNNVEYEDIRQDLAKGKRILFVDDINDTGLTIRLFKEEMSRRSTIAPLIDTACVCQRHSTEHPADYYHTLIEDDTWIVFPYEI